MMVTFVSQCEKKALNKTRRVLDAFANRIGDNTWQTVITQEGLNAVKKLLKKTATKNTAVSCHWIRSRSRSEFIWAIGNRNKFNPQGVVPVNYAEKKSYRSQDENDWKYLPLIKALTALAALFHDWGKGNKAFQEKLKPNSKNRFKGDPLRHEWISCLLLSFLVQNCADKSDEGWLTQLANGIIDENSLREFNNAETKKPFADLPPSAQLIVWLILSHHRLPVTYEEDWRGEIADSFEAILKRITKEWGYCNQKDEKDFQKRVKNCFDFPNGFLSQSDQWRKQVKKWSHRMLNCLPLVQSAMSDGSFRSVLHHARLCMMLGDHFYSSRENDKKWLDKTGLFANTDRKTKEYKQKLDEHLLEVMQSALNITHLLPAFENELPIAADIRNLKKASRGEYRWQDKAVEKTSRWKTERKDKKAGFFAVNMASTGCGKTFANAKVMRALSEDGQSLRYTLALGLRTLTLQTGDEYRERIGLDNSELAVLIGSKAVMDLHRSSTSAQEQDNQEEGSESRESLLVEDIDYDCDIPEEGLATVLTTAKERKFLYSPVLTCTIDHVMGATETRRGGRFILPVLRLMSSDLVIDEIDDFTGSDLIAINRLVFLTGMLGRKVMISSATIPPDLAEGYFHAYQQGWGIYQKNRETAVNEIGCAWIDEFKTSVHGIDLSKADTEVAYHGLHSEFISTRVDNLSQQPVRRKAEIVECQSLMEECELDLDETKQERYFSALQQAVIAKHRDNHTRDEKFGIHVSFGVVRMANISPCIRLAQYLLHAKFPEDTEVRVMAYHSRQVLLLRHQQEAHLDVVLKRKEKNDSLPAAFADHVIRSHIDSCRKPNLIFILVATPVEEVGRDHDFDWAVVEPSSYRSIIQLAGRVRRHRESVITKPNIGLMQYNWKAFKGGDKSGERYFEYPGYESDDIKLNTHNLQTLVDIESISERLDAIPRIKKLELLDYQNALADLEHFVIQRDLNNNQSCGPETTHGYNEETWYLTALPQTLNPFRKSASSVNLFLVYDERKDKCYFAEKDEQGHPVDVESLYNITQIEFNKTESNRLWLVRDYKQLLAAEAEKRHAGLTHISLRFGELNLTTYGNQDNAFEYNDQFGLIKI